VSDGSTEPISEVECSIGIDEDGRVQDQIEDGETRLSDVGGCCCVHSNQFLVSLMMIHEV